ncbi:MAG TPA: division/cell wall cluster transcriptional repressor MraZ [Gammaproteobacteria bacterium]|nr:division/cell wall cluster transcriptional repressor MraZ [Gammaproteobacteria bacterium]
MFRGVNELSLDNKGRVAMPTRYRELILQEADNQLVLTIDTEEKCLLIYPLPEWEKIERQIESLPSFNKAARRVQRLLIGHATEINLDSHGRFLIPPPLRDYAQLDKGIILIGQGKKFELWNEGYWSKCREQWLQEEVKREDDLPPSLLSISL